MTLSRNDKAAYLIHMAYADPEGFKSCFHQARAMTNGGAQFAFDSHDVRVPEVDSFTHNKILKAMYDSMASPSRPISDGELSSEIDRRIGITRERNWTPSQLLALVRQMAAREFGEGWALSNPSGSLSPTSRGQIAGKPSNEKFEQSVNALLHRGPREKPYHVYTGPHKKTEHFARVASGQGAPFSTEGGEAKSEIEKYIERTANRINGASKPKDAEQEAQQSLIERLAAKANR
jgi:hypothetical protein